MNKNIKRFVAILLAGLMAFSCLSVFVKAENSDIPEYNDAVEKLIELEIFSGYENGDFKPQDVLTREQLAKLIVKMLKLDDQVSLVEGTSKFPDVEVNRWSSGYINVAVELGYMNGKLDGNFYPQESINLAAFSTSMIRALGYTNMDLAGVWPYNYIFKANDLELLEDVTLKSSDNVPRWAAALISYRLLDKSMKTNPSLTFAEVYEYYSTHIILETNETSDTLAENEIVTDKGTFNISNLDLDFELGKKYKLSVEDNSITGYFGKEGSTTNISVDSISVNTITYNDKGQTMTMDLPSVTKYYYKGSLTSYESLSNIIQTYSSIVLCANENKIGYEYGVIYDTIYSKPQIASANKLGDIVYEHGMLVTKNGKMIDVSDIKKNDVVYQVNDIWGINKYIIVVDETVDGEITDILPNKISPKEIIIDNIKYQLSEDMNLNKINAKGFITIDDSVTLLLGRNGKVVDVVMTSSEDNSTFALVLDNYKEASLDIEDFGTETYFIRLLHIDGVEKTYKFNEEELGYNGKLVEYEVIKEKTDDDNYQTVKIEEVEYEISKEYTIDKDKRKLGENYFSDNIVIFNLVRTTFGADSTAYVMDWEDLPNGLVRSGKVKHINKTGDFEDINLMLVNNILDEDKVLGVVTKIEQSWYPGIGITYTNTILVDGKEYITNYNIDGMYKNSIVEARINKGMITSLEKLKTPWVESVYVSAIDENRVKIKDSIYDFNENVRIYFKDYDGKLERKGIKDITPTKGYGRISVYLDESIKYDGKVSIIIVSPY